MEVLCRFVLTDLTLTTRVRTRLHTALVVISARSRLDMYVQYITVMVDIIRSILLLQTTQIGQGCSAYENYSYTISTTP